MTCLDLETGMKKKIPQNESFDFLFKEKPSAANTPISPKKN